MEHLTIEELYTLPIGEQVQIVDLNDGEMSYCIFSGIEDDAVIFDGGKVMWNINHYGTDWVVCKSKEKLDNEQEIKRMENIIIKYPLRSHWSAVELSEQGIGDKKQAVTEVLERLKEYINGLKHDDESEMFALGWRTMKELVLDKIDEHYAVLCIK